MEIVRWEMEMADVIEIKRSIKVQKNQRYVFLRQYIDVSCVNRQCSRICGIQKNEGLGLFCFTKVFTARKPSEFLFRTIYNSKRFLNLSRDPVQKL
jgi:hypothetical protein